MKNSGYLIFFTASLLLISCKTVQQSSNTPEKNTGTSTMASSTVETNNQTLTLADYFRKIPGIQVTGTGSNPDIRVRMAISAGVGDTAPLYVIDNNPVGNNYSTAAAMVDVNDIKSITVLKDVASTSMYGFQGANGVIIIRLKKGTDK